MSFPLLSNVSYEVVSSSGNIITVTLSEGTAAAVGSQYVAFARNSTSSSWAELLVTQTTTTTITVNRVLKSSESNYLLPIFVAGDLLYSAVTTEHSNCNEDIILAFGQSNMEDTLIGGSNFDAIKHAFPNIWHYPYSGALQDTRVELNKSGMITRDTLGQGIQSNALPANFANAYSRYIGDARRVLVINHASSGLGYFGGWSPTNGGFGVALVAAANKALSENPNARIAAVIGHLGESDAGDYDQAGMTAQMAALDAYIRANLNTTDAFTAEDIARLPFLYGGLQQGWVGSDPDRLAIQAALEDAGSINDYSIYVDSTGLTGRSGDPIHFSIESAELFGVRYFDAYKAFMESGAQGITAQAPGEFGALSTSNVSYTSVDVSAAAVTGAPTPTYNAQYRVGAGSWVTATTGLSTPSYSFTGLTENTQYGFRFIATNGVDPQRTSNEVTATTLDAVAPSALGTLSESALGKNTITLSTTNATGSPTPTYTAEYKETASGTWLEAATDLANASYVYTGLTPNTQYDFRIIADNGFGTSTSPTYTQTTLQGTAPAAFGALTQDSLGYFDAQYSAATVAGDPTPTYNAEINENGAGWTTAATGLATPVYNFTGLTDNTAYQVRFVATNGVNPDSVSSAESFTTLDAVAPGAFGALTQDALTATSATYSAATVTGAPTPTYNAELNINSAGWNTVATGLATPSYEFTGLAESTPHQIRFVATNGFGSDSVSAIESFTTLSSAIVPFAEYRLNTGITTNGSTTFTWADQSGNGNDAVEHSASYVPTDNGAAGIGFANDALKIPEFDHTGGYTKIVRVSFANTSGFQNVCSGQANFLWKNTTPELGGTASGAGMDVGIPMVANTEYLVAVTHGTDQTMRLYELDGGVAVVRDTATFKPLANPTAGTNVMIGALPSTTNTVSSFMTGTVKDVVVYTQELDQAAVEAKLLEIAAT